MRPAQTGGRSSVEPDPSARVVTRTRAVEDVSVRSLLASRDSPRLHWADRDGLELTGVGAAICLTADGPDRFASIRDAATTLFEHVDHEGPPATRPRLVGGFSFDAAEDRPRDDDTWAAFPSAMFVLPRLQLTAEDGRTWLSATAVGEAVTSRFVESQLEEAIDALQASTDAADESGATGDGTDRGNERPPGVRRTVIEPGREEWTADVERAVEHIAAGTLRKIVLATSMDVELEAPVDLPSTLDRLRRTYPECYRFLVQPTDDAAFLGPPPERLVKLTDGEVRTEALAGSIPRGDTPEADDARAQSLRDDTKRQHEQQLVVDAIREELSAFGEVTEHEQTVRRLATIQHLRTPITVSLSEPVHVLSLVEALHPTPAVGGLPREPALDAIRETEAFDRGWYAAPVGWIDADGDGEFTVAIRSGVVDGASATLFAGNGIVADSDPEEEWAEIEPKFRSLLEELQ